MDASLDGAGLACLRYRRGVGVAGPSPSSASRITARFLRGAPIASVAIGAAVCVAWILGVPSGTGLGRAMLVATSSLIFVALLAWTAAALRRVDARRRAAEQALLDAEAHTAAILASVPGAIVSVDAAGVITELNPAAEAMFGRSRDAARGTPVVGWLADGPQRDELAHRLATGAPTTGERLELVAIRADAGEFPVELSISRVGRDEPTSYTMLFHDVSDTHRARAELLRSGDRLHALALLSDAFAQVATTYQPLIDEIARTIANILGDGCLIMMISDDGEHLYNAANAHRDPALDRDYKTYLATMAVVRTSSASVSGTVVRTGQPIRADVSPEAIVAASEDALKPLVARLDVHGYAVVPIRARHTVIGTLSVLRNSSGRSYTDDDVTLLQDLADRAGLAIENARLYALLEQRVGERTADLEAANQELEAFSYSVAHDLRAPLRAVSGFSHALLEDAAERLAPDDARHVELIRDAAGRMSELIDDLLDLSRISRTEPRRRRINLSQIARAVFAVLRAAEPDREVEFVVADDLAANADPRLVEIVLTNLLGNAWKFTGKRDRARIELGAQLDQRPAVYFVRDNGAGFDPAQAGKLFGVFQRLHTAGDFEGTGIGLATVQRIIHRHGGRIWAEAEVDRGATFYFTLQPPPLTGRVASPRSPS